MRRLILQPPRTCNCFHLVLAKFCIFDTCNFCVSLRRLAKGNRMRWSKGPDMPFSMPGQLLAKCQKSSTFAAWFSSEWTSLTEVSSGAETFSTSSFFLSPKIRDFRGLHKGKAMRSDEDSLRRRISDNDNVNDNDNKLPTPTLTPTPKLFDS